MKKWILTIFLLFLLVFVVVGLSRPLTLTEYSISNPRIPDSYDGYRIAVVSDLHAERFGADQGDLIAMLLASDCDLICFIGDLVSFNTADFSPVWELIDSLPGIPMVYAAGNNELSMNQYEDFLSELRSRGVTVLDEDVLPIDNGADRILIHGYPFRDSRQFGGCLPVSEKGFYNILLYHDPYCFQEAAALDYDLMLSGHIHGGVVRLPLLGSPLEWLNMEPYTRGLYTGRAATLIVSGGLGSNSVLPRFFSAPEVVLVTLNASNS